MDKSKQFVGGRPDVHHHASGRAVKPARSSNANPAFSTPCSSSGWPMIWRPSGRPKASRPAGTDIAGRPARLAGTAKTRSEEQTSELQALMRISYAVLRLNKKNKRQYT